VNELKDNFWDIEDFNLFLIDGLENRMNALQKQVQPKFAALGDQLVNRLSAHGTGEFFTHVARHARRTVNPPTDSWVAMAPLKRGYKAIPHFQIGLWSTHLFIIIAVIYENPDKKGIAERLEKKIHTITSLPDSYIVSGDHMKPDAFEINDYEEEELLNLLERLKTVKKAEFLVGRHLSKEDAVKMTSAEFLNFTTETIDELLPVYDVIIGND